MKLLHNLMNHQPDHSPDTVEMMWIDVTMTVVIRCPAAPSNVARNTGQENKREEMPSVADLCQF